MTTPPKEHDSVTSVRLSEDFRRRLTAAAKEMGVSRSEALRILAELGLTAMGK